MNPDWKDIALHAAFGALLAFVLALLVPLWLAFILNALFWFVREVRQDFLKGHLWPDVWPLRMSTQKWAEFLVPAFTGALMMIVR